MSSVVVAALGVVTRVGAVDTTWTAAVNNDFYTAGNWDTNAVPTAADNVLILNPAVTASINFTGNRELGSFHLGTDGATGGSVDFSSGTLDVHADFDRSHIGDRGAADSKFVIRGSAVLLYDEPLSGGSAGLGSAGGNQDLEIGAQTGATGNLGLLELHDNAILRISDDLKVGAEANGNGEVLIDGNARISVGSGISLSEAGDNSKGKMTVAGTALVVSGNSAGAGNAAEGLTDEGYFTLATNNGSTADLLIKDSGKVYARTLQARGGVSNMTIQDSGEFHVFDTFNFAAPQLGVATVAGDPFGPQRASQVSENNGSEFHLLIKNNGKMSIDTAVDDGTGMLIQGLSLAGGNNRGQITANGGAATIELRDNASFTVQQNLYMTAASAGGLPVGASSSLKIVGPNVDANIVGNLYMSFDPNNVTANGDPSTLSAVITGSTHSTIEVGGTANIEFGNLAVELSGYAPHGGESYTLLTAGTVAGANFLNTDFTLAPLAAGLSWDLDVNPTSVVLKVLGSVSIPGDYDGDQDVDGNDFLRWQRGQSPTPLSVADLNAWKSNYGPSATGAAQSIPEPTSLWLAAAAISACVVRRSRRLA
jgi:hypothetical protein